MTLPWDSVFTIMEALTGSKPGDIVEIRGLRNDLSPEALHAEFSKILRHDGEFVRVENGVLEVQLASYGLLRIFFDPTAA